MQCKTCVLGLSKRSGLIMSVVLVTVLASGCSQSAPRINYFADDATSMESFSAHDETSSIQSKSAEELVSAGFIYLASKNLRIAELHFAQAINKDPKMVNAYLGLARIEMSKSNYKGAIIRFGQARELDPQSIYALTGEARALRLEGKLNEATKKINAAMAVNPKNINVISELAIIYDLTGKESLSEPLYHEIITMAPDQAASHNNLGLNYMVRGEYQEAVLSFLQAHSLDKENLLIRNNLASAYLLSGDQYNAIEIFKGTVGEASAYNNVGYLLMTQGKLDEAEQAFKKALQINPKHYVRAQENLDKLQRMRHATKNKINTPDLAGAPGP